MKYIIIIAIILGILFVVRDHLIRMVETNNIVQQQDKEKQENEIKSKDEDIIFIKELNKYRESKCLPVKSD